MGDHVGSSLAIRARSSASARPVPLGVSVLVCVAVRAGIRIREPMLSTADRVCREDHRGTGRAVQVREVLDGHRPMEGGQRPHPTQEPAAAGNRRQAEAPSSAKTLRRTHGQPPTHRVGYPAGGAAGEHPIARPASRSSPPAAAAAPPPAAISSRYRAGGECRLEATSCSRSRLMKKTQRRVAGPARRTGGPALLHERQLTPEQGRADPRW